MIQTHGYCWIADPLVRDLTLGVGPWSWISCWFGKLMYEFLVF